MRDALERRGGPAVGEDEPGGAVGDRPGEPLGREVRVEQGVRGAGLQHREQAGHQVRAALDQDRDDRPPGDAPAGEEVREPVGPPVQLGVAQRLAGVAGQQGGGVRGLLGPRLEQGVHGRVDGGGEGVRPAVAELGDGRRVEEVAVVLEAAGEAGAPVVDGDRQVEARDVVGVQLAGDGGVADGERPGVQRVQLQHDLAERVAVLLPLLGPSLQDEAGDVVERGLLVAVAADRHLADVPDEFAEARALLDLQPQRQQVDEVPDQAVQFGAPAQAHRRADDQVAFAGAAVQRQREAGQQHHERRGVLAAGERAQRAGDGRRHREAVVGAAEGLELRARVVGRQRRILRCVLQLLLPVSELGLGAVVLVLPGTVVGVLDGQLGQPVRAAGQQRRVQLLEFVLQDGQRALVPDDVVDDQQQRRRALRGAERVGAQQRAALQVEGLPGVPGDQGVDLLGGDEVERERDGDPLVDDLLGARLA